MNASETDPGYFDIELVKNSCESSLIEIALKIILASGNSQIKLNWNPISVIKAL